MKISDRPKCSLLLMLVFLSAATGPARAATPANLIEGQLLADTTAVQPGKPFTLAIDLKITPLWHIYWKNPADAGDPPRFTFQLPPGYAAGEVKFPLPIKFVQPGNIIGYGYLDRARFLATITPPKELSTTPPPPQTIAVKVNWLCCRDVCTPGTTTLELSLPVAKQAAAANREIFAQVQALIPLDSPPDQLVSIVPTVVPGPTAAFTLAITWKQPPRQVEPFPEAVDNLDVEDIKATTDGATTRVSFSGRVLKGQTLTSKTLPLLVTYQDASGPHGFYTQVDLQALQTAKP